MFDKVAYRKRRNEGLRGQEDLTPAPKLAVWTKEDHEAGKCGEKQIGKERTSGVTMMMTKKGLIANPRRVKRRKLVNRHATKKGHVYGAKIGSKEFNILQNRRKHFIGKTFGTAIVDEHTDKDGKLTISTHYTFPAKTKHLRSVSEELEIHREKAAEIESNSGIIYGETNKQRFERKKEQRNAANSAKRAASSAA
jgi:hypothetical protein